MGSIAAAHAGNPGGTCYWGRIYGRDARISRISPSSLTSGGTSATAGGAAASLRFSVLIALITRKSTKAMIAKLTTMVRKLP